LALAGLAIAFPIQMIILAVAQVVGIGAASIVSRSLGAGDQRRADRTAGTTFGVVAALSLVVTGFGLLFLDPILRLFGATPEVMPYAAQYLSVILGGCFFFMFSVSSNNVARAEGNVRLAMISMVIGAGVNVALDPIFIFTLGMGVRGAAIATVIANFCSAAYLLAYFVSGKSMLHIRRADLVPDPRLLPEIFTVGSPALMRVGAGSVLAIALNNSIAHYGDNTHLAVFGAVNKALMFILLPVIGLVQGLQPIIGFNYGAKNMKRVREAVWDASIFSTFLATLGFALLMLFPGPIFGLFSKEPRFIEEGARIVRIVILCIPLVGFQIVGATLFQALGKAFPSLFLSMSRQILFLLPLILLLPLRYGQNGLWISFPLADFLSVFVTAAWVAWQMRLLREHEAGQTMARDPLAGE
jgi:putative MATE family efflux protein